MEKIINGLRYSTEESDKIAQTEWVAVSAFYEGPILGFSRLTFYKTKNGRYFTLYERADVKDNGWFKPCTVGGVSRQDIHEMTYDDFVKSIYSNTGKYIGEVTPA